MGVKVRASRMVPGAPPEQQNPKAIESPYVLGSGFRLVILHALTPKARRSKVEASMVLNRAVVLL